MNATGRRALIITIAAVLIVVAIILSVTLTNRNEISFDGKENSLIASMKAGEVKTLTLTGNYRVDIEYVDSNKKNAYCYIDSRSQFYEVYKSVYESENAPAVKAVIVYDNPSTSSTIFSLIVPAIALVLLVVFFVMLFKQSGGAGNKAFSFGKTKANMAQNVKVRFTDVAGAEEEKEELKEIVDFLKDSKKFREIGARVPKGVLLVGPPGTGKTLFAKAVAGEANVPFFSLSGSDFVEMFVGVGASRVRDLFDQAKKNMPCIIFIDEIDAVGRQRGAGLGGGNDEREQTLNQLLVQMDGFESNDSIIVMAATNRADILDPALMRPGRFDRQIFVNTPDVKGREEIFKVHSRNKPLSPDIDFKAIARLTVGFTGADIENLLNEAAILAARADRKVIEMADINEAINKVIAGPAKKSRVVTQFDKRITAYHESGHAICAKRLKYCDDVHEVSIIPRGMAAGYTITLPETDDMHMTYNKLCDTIAMMLGGRAAEELVIKDVTTGASNDIQRATSIARKMVTEWGMSKNIGTMHLGSSQEVFIGRDFQTQVNYSDAVAAKIDAEIKAILDEAHERAINILKENRDILDKMVKILFEKETIFANEVDELFGEGKSEEDKADIVKTDGGKSEEGKSDIAEGENKEEKPKQNKAKKKADGDNEPKE